MRRGSNENLELPELNKARSQDFRLYLQSELSRRVKEYPQYSLRSFGRALAIDPSALVKLLKGKRPLGSRLITRLGKHLDLAPDEIEEFVKAEKQARARGSTQTKTAPVYQQITLDTFRLIADWYHYAILELIRVDSFRSDPKWIACVLNVPVNEVNFAIDRMIRLGLLKVQEDGQWIDLSAVSTNIAKPFYDSAQRKLQKQILQGAIHALENIPAYKRDQSSMTVAVDTDRLIEAKERIKIFRREIAQFMSRSEKRDQVYQLSISLYPVSAVGSEKQSKTKKRKRESV